MTDYVIVEPSGELTEGDGYPGDVVGCHGYSGQMLHQTRSARGTQSTMLRMIGCDCALLMPEVHDRNPVAVAMLRQLGYPHQVRGRIAILRVDWYQEPIALTPRDLEYLQGLAAAARADEAQTALPLVLDDEEPPS